MKRRLMANSNSKVSATLPAPLEADESEERFNATLKDLARSPREAKALKGKTLDDLAEELVEVRKTLPLKTANPGLDNLAVALILG